MLLIRRILFAFFATVYVFACPLLILYALGYIYNPVRGGFVQTGLLHLSTIPSDADIYLEHSHFTNSTPASIRDLVPGSYNITLRKKDYLPWTHTVTIEAGKAAVYKNILLIPSIWPVKNLTSAAYEELIPLQNRDQFLLRAGPSLGNFFVYNKDNSLRSLLPPESLYLDFSPSKVQHIDKTDALLIYGGSLLKKQYVYFTLGKELDAVDVTDLIDSKFSFITCSDRSADRLYTFSSNGINYIDLAASQVSPSWLENVKGFGLYDDFAYVLDSNNTLARLALDSRKKEILTWDLTLAQRLLSRSDFYQIIARTDKAIFFLGTKGDLVLNLPPYLVAAESVTGLDFHRSLNKMLFWGEKFLSIVDFSAGAQTTMLGEQFIVKPVFENPRGLTQAFWAYEDSHVLYNDDEGVHLVELEPQGPNHVYPVVKVKKGTSVFYSADDNILYYLNENSGILMGLQIVPQGILPAILAK